MDAALSKKKYNPDGRFDDGGQDEFSPAELRGPQSSTMAFGFDTELEFPRYQTRLRKRFVERRALVAQILADARAGLSPPELPNLPQLPPLNPESQLMNPFMDMFEGEKRCLTRVVRFFSFPNGIPDNISREMANRLPAGAAGVEVSRTGTVRFNQKFFVRAAVSEAPLTFRARQRTRRHSLSDMDELKEDAYFEVLLTKVPKPRDERSRPVNISIGLAQRPFPPFCSPGTVPLSLGISITPGHKIRLLASTSSSPNQSPTVIEVKLPKGKQAGAVSCKEGDTIGILLKKTTRSSLVEGGKRQCGLKAYLLINGETVTWPNPTVSTGRANGGRSSSFSGSQSPAAARADPYDLLQTLGYPAYSKFVQAAFMAEPNYPPDSPEVERNLNFETPGLHAVVASGGPCELFVDLNARVPPGVPGYDQMSPDQNVDDDFGLGSFGLAADGDESMLQVPMYAGLLGGSRPPSYRSHASHRASQEARRHNGEAAGPHGGLVGINGEPIPNTPPPDYSFEHFGGRRRGSGSLN